VDKLGLDKFRGNGRSRFEVGWLFFAQGDCVSDSSIVQKRIVRKPAVIRYLYRARYPFIMSVVRHGCTADDPRGPTAAPLLPRPRRLPRCGRIPGIRKVSENSKRSPLGNGGCPWQGMSPTPTNLRTSDCPAPSSCAWHKGCPAQWRGRIKYRFHPFLRFE
jgi:hypothetical protein